MPAPLNPRVRALPTTPCLLCAAAAAAMFCAGPAHAQFGPPVNVNVGVGVAPQRITGTAAGDVDGDGNQDLVAVDTATNGSIGCARGLGGGAYAAPVLSPGTAAVGGAFEPALGDFDLDGFLDLAYTGTSGGVATVFVAAGDSTTAGAFVTPPAVVRPLLPGDSVTELSVTDVTGDGDQDVLVAVTSPVPGNRRIATLPGGPGVSFGPIVVIGTWGDASDIDVCVSFNKDGFKDVVACLRSPSPGQPAQVHVFRGKALTTPPQNVPFEPTPAAVLNLPPNVDPTGVHWIDCDQADGGQFYDLVLTLQGQVNGAVLIRNLGAPPFFTQAGVGQPLTLPATPLSPIRLEADFNGVEDLSLFSAVLTPTAAPTSLQVMTVVDCVPAPFFGSSAGTYDSGKFETDVAQLHAVSDQDGDGREDLVFVNHTATQDRVVVLPNVAPASFTVSPPKPLLGSVVPFTFRFDGPPAAGGQRYALLMTTHGTLPGVKMSGSVTLPLNPPFLPAMITGTLPPSGDLAFTTLPIPMPKTPTGFSLQVAMAIVVFNSAGAPAFASNPAVVTFP